MELTLQARVELGKSVKFLRAKGFLPAVVYGAKQPATSVAVEARAFESTYYRAGKSTLVELSLPEEKKVHALIHDIQRDPVTDRIIHADFYVVDMSKVIRTSVPLTFSGTAPAEKENLGILVKNLTKLEIEALPDALPQSLTVSVEKLSKVGDHVLVSDIGVPQDVKVLGKADEIVATITPLRSEAELESLKEEVHEEVEKVETVKKEKPLEEGEEAPATEGVAPAAEKAKEKAEK
ncbi:MAG: 50S ribosomal protein L25 [Parcubacteria group bacterium]|nr:50S ribosomal protein L25 [Parcubacteria group bacterium]